eukprot:scaffold2549_cov333-Pavlova_lutheri.AAC.14
MASDPLGKCKSRRPRFPLVHVTALAICGAARSRPMTDVFAGDGTEVQLLVHYVLRSLHPFARAPVLRRRAAAPAPPAPFGTIVVGIVLQKHVFVRVQKRRRSPFQIAFERLFPTQLTGVAPGSIRDAKPGTVLLIGKDRVTKGGTDGKCGLSLECGGVDVVDALMRVAALEATL